MADTFKKIIPVEMDEEDVQLWRWICRAKNKWVKISKIREGEVRLNMDSGGNVKFKFIVDDI